jgi:hypothetical protein
MFDISMYLVTCKVLCSTALSIPFWKVNTCPNPMNGGCEEKGLEKNEYNAFLIQKNKIQILIVIKS